MPYSPPLTITPRLIDLVSRISESLGRSEGADIAISPKLRRKNDRGTHAPSRVFVFDALVENRVEWPAPLVFGEGAKDDTRGACAPRGCLSEKFEAHRANQT